MIRDTGPVRYRMWSALLAVCLCVTATVVLAAVDETVNPTAEDGLPRHPLELAALTAPETVLKQLPAEIAKARELNDQRKLALLYLAEANACRVIANWQCQRKAGSLAGDAAKQAGDPILQVRGMINESRGGLLQQDFSHSEQLLGEAQLILEKSPSPELSADIYLAYSGLSQFIGKHAMSAEYAERGLAGLVGEQGLAMQVRLLRNLARARSELGDFDAARVALDQAEQKVRRLEDPKLRAEVLLEAARLARARRDYGTHDTYIGQMMELAESLKNPQILARALEAQGLASVQRNRPAEAEQQLQRSYEGYRDLNLPREERRVLRPLLSLKSASATSVAALTPLLERMITLESELDESDRAQASDDFDSRLKYAQQSMEVERLQVESELASEREAALARANRLTTLIAALIGVVVIVLAVFFVQQRRTNALLRSAFSKLHASQAQTQDLLQLSAGYVFLIDDIARIQRANPAMAFALGRSPKSLVGSPLSAFLAGDGAQTVAALLQRLQTSREDECVVTVRDVQGRERQWRLSSRVSEPKGGVRYIVVNGVDVTEQLHQTEILREQSLRDALTGSYNRRYLEEFEQRRPDARWAAIAVDLDQFKAINDQLGHERGDQVLQDIARFLSERVRSEDAVVRLGGDEFVVLLAQADEASMKRLTDRLQAEAQLASCGFSHGSALRLPGESLADTLARADSAMYEDKRAHQRGRG